MGINVNLNQIASGFNLATINSNFKEIKTALEEALSREGSTPNQMEASLDMNGNNIINVGSIGLVGEGTLADAIEYAKEWAEKDRGEPVSEEAGGNGSQYSAKNYAEEAREIVENIEELSTLYLGKYASDEEAGTTHDEGSLYFNSSTEELKVLFEGSWRSTVGGRRYVFSFTGEEGVNTFSLPFTPLSTNTSIFVSGVYQSPSSYNISGEDIVFSEEPPVGVSINVITDVPAIAGSGSVIYNATTNDEVVVQETTGNVLIIEDGTTPTISLRNDAENGMRVDVIRITGEALVPESLWSYIRVNGNWRTIDARLTQANIGITVPILEGGLVVQSPVRPLADVYVTTNLGAGSGCIYRVDSLTGNRVITLPENPSNGDTIGVAHVAGGNSVTIARNLQKIDGRSEDLVLPFGAVWIGTFISGDWRSKTDYGTTTLPSNIDLSAETYTGNLTGVATAATAFSTIDSLDLSIVPVFSGFIPSNNAGAPTTSLDFTAGMCSFPRGASPTGYASVAACTVNLSSDVTLPASGTVHVNLCEDNANAGTFALKASLTTTGAPTGWTFRRRVASVTTNASSQVIACTWKAERGGALRTIFGTEITVTSSLASGTLTLPVATGIETDARIQIILAGTAAFTGMIYCSVNPVSLNQHSGFIAFGADASGSVAYQTQQNGTCLTNTSGQITVARGGSDGEYASRTLYLSGFTDYERGV